MFALLALICFVLALFDVRLGGVNLVELGWVFVAAYLLFGGDWVPAVPGRRRQ